MELEIINNFQKQIVALVDICKLILFNKFYLKE